MLQRSRLWRAVGAVAVSLGACSAAKAATFASQVVPSSFVQGTVSGSTASYNDPNAAVGAPSGITGVSAGFPGVVSVFNPAFDTGQIVVLGVGGHVTLQFPSPVEAGTGPAVGVFSNIGLIDANYPSGVSTSPASDLSGGVANVRVSQDGVHFVSLGVKQFNIPTNYYLNAGPYDTTAPANPQVAHFATPFTGRIGAFSGETYAQILSTLNGSAGGKWLTLSGTGLSEINYIKFTVPANSPANSQLAIDAVSVAHGHVGVSPSLVPAASAAPAVPLPPAALTGLAGLAGVLALQSRRRKASI